MNKNRHLILTGTLTAVGIAAVLFCAVCIIFDITYKGDFHLGNYMFTKMALGAFIIGLGFGLPTFIYANDNMPVAAKAIIHMGIGCIVMTITAFIVGWIPLERGAGPVIGTIAGEITTAFLIWLLFYAHNRNLAKQINQRIAELNE